MMSNTSQAPPTSVPQDDTEGVRTMIHQMSRNLETLETTLRDLNQQSSKISAMGPTSEGTSSQIDQLREQMKNHLKNQTGVVKTLKEKTQTTVPEKVLDSVRPRIQEDVKDEIEKQANQLFDAHIKEYLPVSFPQQLKDCETQISEINKSLANSGARRANATMPVSDLDEPLQVVLKADGKKGDLFPTNLRSLFSYDSDMTKKLVKDYGLPEDPVRENNLNRFMWHIGIRFSVVPMSARSDEASRVLK